MNANHRSKVILFDGYCGLCNKSVNWIIAKDSEHHFKFTPLQGEFLRSISISHIQTDNPKSIIYLDGTVIYHKSTAALRIAKELPFPWKLLYAFIIVPRPIRDYIYDIIANNRYQWFGQLTSCRVPTANEKQYFLD